MAVQIKRVYDEPEPGDGYRVLIDRLWPRGLSKERASVDLWCKQVAPSTELRTWFGHRRERFAEFSRRYLQELDDNPALDVLRQVLADHPTVTLVYGAKDREANDAVVLAQLLDS